jgi:hypothetical protein
MYSRVGKSVVQAARRLRCDVTLAVAPADVATAESEALLGELQRLLAHSGSDNRWLINVRPAAR